MHWRIYYDDGSTYSDADGDPFHAPALGVLVIAYAEHNERDFSLIHGADNYIFRADGWHSTDQPGFWDYMFSTGPKKVLFGRTVRNDDFWAAVKRAQKEGLGLPRSSNETIVHE